jgi:hypothetical protein
LPVKSIRLCFLLPGGGKTPRTTESSSPSTLADHRTRS